MNALPPCFVTVMTGCRYLHLKVVELIKAIQKVDTNNLQSVLRFVSRFGLLSYPSTEPIENLTADIKRYRFFFKVVASLKGDKGFIDKNYNDLFTHYPVDWLHDIIAYREGTRPEYIADATYRYQRFIDRKGGNVFSDAYTDVRAKRVEKAEAWVQYVFAVELNNIITYPRKTKDGFTRGVGLNSLKQALYFKTYLDLTAPEGLEYRECQNRHVLFTVGPEGDRKRRGDNPFCSDVCGHRARQRRYNERKREED
ncbi:MAG: hypothetical protein IBX64_10095 [Actinobacteria bacterium]|nr:hypothetical protein [Actinomycetota bacterium]